MNAEQRWLLLAHLVRDPSTIQAADHRLDTSLFVYPTELFEAVCWSVSRDYYRKNRALCPRIYFEAEVKRQLEEQDFFARTPVETVDHYLNWMFDAVPESQLGFTYASVLLEKFLVSRKTEPFFQQHYQGNIPVTELIQRMYQAMQESKIQAAEKLDISNVSLDVFGLFKRIPTGYSVLDTLCGGLRPQETTGVLGPMKGGKTAFCHTLLVEYIRSRLDRSNRATLFTYEESGLQHLMKLVIAGTNKWDRDKVENKTEAEMHPDIAAGLKATLNLLSSRIQIIDMSGTVEGQGLGGVDELVCVMNEMHRVGVLGDLVVVDHLLPLATIAACARGADLAYLRHEIQRSCNEFRATVERLNISGVLAHQLDARGNQSATRRPTHMNAAESKLFAQYLHHCIVLGVKRPEVVDGRIIDVAECRLSASRNLPTEGPGTAMHVWIHGARCRVDPIRAADLEEIDPCMTAGTSGRGYKAPNYM